MVADRLPLPLQCVLHRRHLLQRLAKAPRIPYISAAGWTSAIALPLVADRLSASLHHLALPMSAGIRIRKKSSPVTAQLGASLLALANDFPGQRLASMEGEAAVIVGMDVVHVVTSAREFVIRTGGISGNVGSGDLQLHRQGARKAWVQLGWFYLLHYACPAGAQRNAPTMWE